VDVEVIVVDVSPHLCIIFISCLIYYCLIQVYAHLSKFYNDLDRLNIPHP